MNILGIYCGHDANACLLRDGRVVSSVTKAQLTGVACDRGDVSGCIDHCLAAGGLALTDIDLIATSRGTMLHYRTGEFVSGELYDATQSHSRHTYRLHDREFDCIAVQHHVAHAAAAFFASPFRESAILSLDGGGDFSAALLLRGDGTDLTILRRPRTHLGRVWTAINTTLGLNWLTASGEVMELSAQGTSEYYDRLLEYCGGSLETLDLPDPLEIWRDCTAKIYWEPDTVLSAVQCDTPGVVYGFPFYDRYGVPAAAAALAASIQQLTNDTFLLYADELQRLTGLRNLCLSGGVAMNRIALAYLRRLGLFAEIAVASPPTDAGLAVGAARYAWHTVLGRHRDRADGSAA